MTVKMLGRIPNVTNPGNFPHVKGQWIKTESMKTEMCTRTFTFFLVLHVVLAPSTTCAPPHAGHSCPRKPWDRLA